MSDATSAGGESSNHLDWDFQYAPPQGGDAMDFSRTVQRIATKFMKAVQDAVKNQLFHSSRRRCDVLEGMRHPESELVRRPLLLGGSAVRRGKEDGDLACSEGRKKLFSKIAQYQPQHLWYSPECAPWCKWSVFNSQ